MLKKCSGFKRRSLHSLSAAPPFPICLTCLGFVYGGGSGLQTGGGCLGLQTGRSSGSISTALS